MQKALIIGILSTYFLVVSNLFIVLCTQCGYSGGLLSDYLIPKIYALDIAVVVTIVTFVIALLTTQQKKRKKVVLNAINTLKRSMALQITLIIWVGILGWQSVTLHPEIGILHWVRISMYSIFGITSFLYIRKNIVFVSILGNKITQLKIVFASLKLALVLQFFISLYQWVWQKHLFGYWFLGEPILTQKPGLSRVVNDGVERILPYGTTAHPNVLGGISAMITILCIVYFIQKKDTQNRQQSLFKLSIHMLHILPILSGFTIVLLTQSASAASLFILAGLVLGEPWKVWKHVNHIPQKKPLLIVMSILVIWIGSAYLTHWYGKNLVTEPSWYRRAYLIETSLKMTQKNGWNEFGGTGLGQFTAIAPQSLRPHEFARFNQPVHHGPLLFISETGILGLGLILFILLGSATYKKNNLHTKQLNTFLKSILLISPLLVWDHYIVSLPPGNMSLILWVVLFHVLSESNTG